MEETSEVNDMSLQLSENVVKMLEHIRAINPESAIIAEKTMHEFVMANPEMSPEDTDKMLAIAVGLAIGIGFYMALRHAGSRT